MDQGATMTDKDDVQKYRQERVSEHAVPEANITSNVSVLVIL